MPSTCKLMLLLRICQLVLLLTNVTGMAATAFQTQLQDVRLLSPISALMDVRNLSFTATPLEVFMPLSWTTNGTYASQKEVCAEAGGIPLLIKTQRTLNDTQTVVWAGGHYLPFNMFAWSCARDFDGDGEPEWPDGEKTAATIFTADRLGTMLLAGGPAYFYSTSQYLMSSFETKASTFPVLCSRNPA
ncbi:uncharacterized protein LOC125179102 [Hyalella azteca]|uniref:Uncharacterized protein LOC125179102 n=1 Tax=Hyalella azteca TaxID=294128 RepID=A0A979FV44_HYAAZ|nr:uncharacterized protein LOC125179102 [Hyalella azteca]